ncbi:hypothetical protein KM914_14925 [Virgibacillus pantothenticus]|uniref:hypothetical protein n=1 Tax=Virgibacillus pantothenticus TaxID=1473 RepID=UPI001C237FBE|nr:hypothetical protein [Virgibacillus pantothenticus]MBU8567699.1 hypothetical protein [Virgibacillus pantothenticus]MBU8602086.1 hypothetical protein [Virgibacillus pantothenticus]MBU8635723.1 hypothetical protein [Virgibacillus pantothenticus]MBU8643933.1 hypothetical protein [Virgibacillus pantothenticus]MBU8648195.1 hypothetical protein [Virgibacillus pantothenticus]
MTTYSIQVDGEGNVLFGDKYIASAYNADIISCGKIMIMMVSLTMKEQNAL